MYFYYFNKVLVSVCLYFKFVLDFHYFLVYPCCWPTSFHFLLTYLVHVLLSLLCKIVYPCSQKSKIIMKCGHIILFFIISIFKHVITVFKMIILILTVYKIVILEKYATCISFICNNVDMLINFSFSRA